MKDYKWWNVQTSKICFSSRAAKSIVNQHGHHANTQNFEWEDNKIQQRETLSSFFTEENNNVQNKDSWSISRHVNDSKDCSVAALNIVHRHRHLIFFYFVFEIFPLTCTFLKCIAHLQIAIDAILVGRAIGRMV